MTKKIKEKDYINYALLEIRNVFRGLNIVENGILDYLSYFDCSVSFDELYTVFCYDPDLADYNLDTHQFYNLYICPLIRKKKIKITNDIKAKTEIPYDEFLLKYVKDDEKVKKEKTCNEIEKIGKSDDIVDVIEKYIPLEKRDKNYFGMCPFHEDTKPSLSVSQEKQIYKCFGCGASGNAVTFVRNYEEIKLNEKTKEHFGSD